MDEVGGETIMVTYLHANCDGGSRGNPGPAAIGGVIRKKNGTILYTFSERIGETTNNVAEYSSLLKTLSLFETYGAGKGVIEMDSQLIVNQVQGTWNVNSDRLKPLHQEVISMLQGKNVKLRYVPRDTEYQVMADTEVNKAFDS